VCCRCFGAATNRGIDNLAAHRQEARSPQSLVKTSEQMSTAPTGFNPSRNLQIVLASGTAELQSALMRRVNFYN